MLPQDSTKYEDNCHGYKFGKKNYETGPGSEYNKLRKYGDRGGK